MVNSMKHNVSCRLFLLLVLLLLCQPSEAHDQDDGEHLSASLEDDMNSAESNTETSDGDYSDLDFSTGSSHMQLCDHPPKLFSPRFGHHDACQQNLCTDTFCIKGINTLDLCKRIFLTMYGYDGSHGYWQWLNSTVIPTDILFVKLCMPLYKRFEKMCRA